MRPEGFGSVQSWAASLACPARLHCIEGRKRLGLCRLPRRARDRRVLRHRCGDCAPIARRRAGSACDGARCRPPRRARQGDGLHSPCARRAGHRGDRQARGQHRGRRPGEQCRPVPAGRRFDQLRRRRRPADRRQPARHPAPDATVRARHGEAQSRPRRQHHVDRRTLCLPRRQHRLSRDQGGRSFPVAAAARPSLRLARARDRDLAGAGRDRGVRPPAGRRRGSATALL